MPRSANACGQKTISIRYGLHHRRGKMNRHREMTIRNRRRATDVTPSAMAKVNYEARSAARADCIWARSAVPAIGRVS